MKRTLAGGLAAWVVFAALASMAGAGTGGHDAQHALRRGVRAPASPPGRPATPEDPLRVLIVGDSVAHDASVGLQAALESTGAVSVESLFPIVFGLTRGYDWRTEFGRLVASQGTEVAVLFLGGAWDQAFAIADPEAYRTVVAEAVDVLAGAGGRVVVIGTPPAPEANMPEVNRDLFNQVFASMEELRPGVATYLDPDPALAASAAGKGGFVEYLPTADGRIARVRKANAHICPEGAARLGNELRQAVAELHPLPAPDPAWYWGDWRADFLYTSSPPGACDF